MKSCRTSLRTIRHNGEDHFATVSVRVAPSRGPSQVVLSPVVRDALREAFGPDAKSLGICLSGGVKAQLKLVTRDGADPRTVAASFQAELVGVRVSRGAPLEVSASLLAKAAMNAVADYLHDGKEAQAGAHDSA